MNALPGEGSGPAERGGVDPAAVERELGELWKRLAGAERTENRALLRACVLNLVVYAPEGERAVDACLQAVTAEHPSRVLVLVPGRRVEGGLRARVTAKCHMVGKTNQICCEQITLDSEEGQLPHLPSLVRSLLVSDLPVVLWWRDRPRFGTALFDELVDSADRIVIDSARGTPGLEALAELHRRVEALPENHAVTDLAWSRITPWRHAVAMLFDAAEDRRQLDRITRVRIASPAAGPGSEAWLLAGWLASRLGWEPLPASPRGGRDRAKAAEQRMEFERDKVRISVTVEQREHRDSRPGILGIRLETPDGAYSVEREAGLLVLSPGTRRASWSMPDDFQEEGGLISRELSIASHDRLFEEALACCRRVHEQESTRGAGDG